MHIESSRVRANNENQTHEFMLYDIKTQSVVLVHHLFVVESTKDEKQLRITDKHFNKAKSVDHVVVVWSHLISIWKK